MNKLAESTLKRKTPNSIMFLKLAVFFAPMRSYGLFEVAGFNVSLFRFFTLLMIFSIIIEFIFYNKRILIDKYIILILLILCYNLFTLFYSNNITNSHFMAMTIGLLWLLFAYSVLNREKKYILEIIKIFIYSSIIPIALGLYQWVYYQVSGFIPDMPFSFILVSEGKTGITFNTLLRITSTFLDPSYYGMFLATVATMSLGIIIHKDVTTKLFGNRFIKRIHFILILSIIGMVQSLSLTSLIGFITGSTILIIYTNKRVKILLKLAIYIFVMLLLVSLYNHIFNYNIFEAILFKVGTQFDRYGLDFGREEYFKLGIQKFLEKPIFGVGFGNVSLDVGIISSAHNTLLTILAQQGIIGLVLHLLFLIIFPFLSIISSSISKNILPLIVFSSIVSMITVSLGYDAMYKIDTGYVVILIVMCFTSKYSINFFDNTSRGV